MISQCRRLLNRAAISMREFSMPESSMTEFEVILTHEHTDFDALASLLAASLLYPDAYPVLPHQLNRNVREFLALYRNHFPFVTHKDQPDFQ